VEHRKTRPYTPRTNGMVERFNGRVQREVLGITIASHRRGGSGRGVERFR
jgi:transposase InsO family protein